MTYRLSLTLAVLAVVVITVVFYWRIWVNLAARLVLWGHCGLRLGWGLGLRLRLRLGLRLGRRETTSRIHTYNAHHQFNFRASDEMLSEAMPRNKLLEQNRAMLRTLAILATTFVMGWAPMALANVVVVELVR